MLEIVITRGGKDLVALPLHQQVLRIGRSETNDLCLPEQSVSRHQCLLACQDDAVEMEDKSGRGTVVDGRPLRKAKLQPGAEINFGSLTAVLREVTQAPAAPTVVSSGDTMVIQSNAPTSEELVLTGTCGKRRIKTPLGGQVLTLGQDPSNDIILDDNYVSAFHCRLFRKGSAWFVADLDSTNGTRVNGVTVSEARLEAGATLSLGKVEMRLVNAREKPADNGFQGLLSQDPAMRPVFATIKRAAPTNETILITGESGTGKEVVAQACYRLSQRAHKPLVALNCAAISKELMESELFGHEKGAFTGAQARRTGLMEEAHQGTMFLDEIGELALDLQAKLLRALESGEIRRVGSNQPLSVDVRVLAATHRSLPQRVQEGEFREDLYYRVCVIEIQLPPLRQRPRDIPLLANYFLEQVTGQTEPKSFSEKAMETLQQYRFPGNVRELKHIVTRAAILCEGRQIDPRHLTFAPPTLSDRVAESKLYRQNKTLREVESEAIRETLAFHDGNQRAAARTLGIARSTLVAKMEKYGIDSKSF